MPNKDSDKKVRLTLRIETDDGKTIERVIMGASNIEYILDEAGIIDNELAALLGYNS